MRKEQILNQHPKDMYGKWIIRGEDPNCDMGGYHSNPILGYAEGKWADVVEYATKLSGFYQWGAGGSITKWEAPVFKHIKENFNMKEDQLLQEKRKLEDRMLQVQIELQNILEI